MKDFKKGELVVKRHCATKEPLQIGIVVADNEASFDIKWTWYSKVFFMEKEQDIFQELNNIHLLNVVRYEKGSYNPLLCRLGDSYKHGPKESSSSTRQETYQADCRQ